MHAAIGLRAHSGWAVLVAVRGPATAPSVILRRRIELADRGIAGAVQPYHAAKARKLDAAEAFVKRCAHNSLAMAREALQTTVDELAERRYTIAGSCILLSSGRVTEGLAAILASHPAIHTAEGDFFRQALRGAYAACGLAVSGIKERELPSRGSAALGIPQDEIERRLTAMGKALGPPWRQDEKLCALAAWLLL